MIRFRIATADDIGRIAPIEIAAGEAFREVGMDTIANDGPIAEAVLLRAVEDRLVWVATELGTIRAYLLAEELPESLHIEQVTVDPVVARRGIGAMLIESVANDPRAIEKGALTLCSFENVPWNAPYYERIGFVDLHDDEWPEGVEAKVEAEKARGLWAWPRVVMRREVHPPL